MRMRRTAAALAAPLVLLIAVRAEAQQSSRLAPEVPQNLAVVPETTPAPRLSSRLIGAVPVGGGAMIGVGRFSVGEVARPRTHTETVRDPAGFARRGRGIAGVGLSIRF